MIISKFGSPDYFSVWVITVHTGRSNYREEYLNFHTMNSFQMYKILTLHKIKMRIQIIRKAETILYTTLALFLLWKMFLEKLIIFFPLCFFSAETCAQREHNNIVKFKKYSSNLSSGQGVTLGLLLALDSFCPRTVRILCLDFFLSPILFLKGSWALGNWPRSMDFVWLFEFTFSFSLSFSFWYCNIFAFSA